MYRVIPKSRGRKIPVCHEYMLEVHVVCVALFGRQVVLIGLVSVCAQGGHAAMTYQRRVSQPTVPEHLACSWRCLRLQASLRLFGAKIGYS